MMRSVQKYVELTKPKVSLLNLFVGVTCFVLAEFPSINWMGLAIFIVVGYLTVGGCGALNCYLDRDMDALMSRTSQRAIPAGKIAPVKALIYGLILTSTGLIAAYYFFGILTSLLVSMGIVFYVFVYTLTLKRATSWNILIGAIAGPFAALSGWTATGNGLSLMPFLIGLLDFLWTPGHLWGLAIKHMNEYKSAGVPMLPVVSGFKRSSELVLLFNIAAIGSSSLFLTFGRTGVVYLIIATALGFKLVFESHKLLVTQSDAQASKVFLTSAPYLAAVMVGLIIDKFALLSLPQLWAAF